jgi:hypothetical protein
MADNLNVTPGTGAVIRMVEKSSNKAQVVVLDRGGAGAESLWDGSVSASENHIGEVGGNITWAEANFSRPANVSGYIIGDMVSNSVVTTAMMTLSGMARINGGEGYIMKARLGTNQAANVAAYRMWLYTVNNPTLVADNVPFSLLWANRSSRLGYIDFPAMTSEMTGSDCAFATWSNSGVFPFTTASADKNLYAVLETKTAFTPDSSQAYYLEVFADAA